MEGVSVIIPTRDAGPLFHRVLASLRRQDGVPNLEIVIVDSGSRDGTREAAAASGARVERVPPDEFGHGRTRNLGAEYASGHVLVMLSQDAVPLGNDALRTLALELVEDARLAAVSARQVPRSDADLHASFVVLSHERVLSEAARASARRPLRELSPLQQRALAGVDDVCAAFRRAAWEELRFADLPFAEDLDFGLRAVERGWRVSRSSVAVAHSHNRDAVHSLRRAAADRIALAPLVGDRRRARAADRTVHDIFVAGRRLVGELAAAADYGAAARTLHEHLQRVRGAVAATPVPAPPQGELAALDDFLAAAGPAEAADARTASLLREDLLALLTWPVLREFARAHPAVETAAAAAFVAKVAGSAIGRAAGDAARGRDPSAAALLLEGV